MYAANQQIGVATTLPHSSEVLHVPQNMAASVDTDHGHSAQSSHSQDDRFSQRDANVTGSEVSFKVLAAVNMNKTVNKIVYLL